MRNLLFSFLLPLAACSGGSGPRSAPSAATSDPFRIRIEESGLANSGHPEWVVTSDSVAWTWKRPGGEDERVVQALAPAARDTIRARLQRLDLAAIPANVQGDAPVDDLPEFRFSLFFKGQQKDFQLYLARIPALLDLVAAVNGALPQKYYIPYDEEYLHYTE